MFISFLPWSPSLNFITGGDRGTDSTCSYSNIDGQEENACHTGLDLDKNVTLRLKAVHSWLAFWHLRSRFPITISLLVCAKQTNEHSN